MKRKISIERKTNETDIKMELNLDGSGKYSINTPVGFLNHMLELFSKHGSFDLAITASGDTNIDEHHTVEDVGLVLGLAFAKALGEKRGINRYGFFIIPMDESLTTVAIDLSGRYSSNLSCDFQREKVGDLPTEMIYDFWSAFAQNTKCNLFIKEEYGRNDHHKIEGMFKATAQALRIACTLSEKINTEIPSTKGIL